MSNVEESCIGVVFFKRLLV